MNRLFRRATALGGKWNDEQPGYSSHLWVEMEQYNVRQDELVSQESVDSALVISLGRLRTKIDGQVKNNELHMQNKCRGL